MRVAVTGCLVLLYIVALQGDQADGHITFFSPKEMRELRVSVHFNSTFSSTWAVQESYFVSPFNFNRKRRGGRMLIHRLWKFWLMRLEESQWWEISAFF